MRDYQKAFIDLALRHEALRFGEFTLKSGRTSPYFFNAGQFQSGAALAALGGFYAQAIVEAQFEIDMLFGPAYKGIPLATATAIALSSQHQRDYPVCYNRKEAKRHGERGMIMGAAPTGRVAIIDDVITAGTAIRDAIQIIRHAEARPSAVVVGLDRQERGEGDLSAIQEIERSVGIPVISIIRLEDIIAYLQEGGQVSEHLSVQRYREKYGI